jgi:hypothetical protein
LSGGFFPAVFFKFGCSVLLLLLLLLLLLPMMCASRPW